jgi:hypothetical protein
LLTLLLYAFIVALRQKPTVPAQLDKYTVLFAVIRKQARFGQNNRHSYLLLKKEKQSNLEA